MKYFRRYLQITKQAASVQASILLGIVYFLLLVPLGLFFKISSPETLRGYGYRKKHKSFWIPKDNKQHDLNWAKRQF
jgi:hypothetical protein